MKEKWFKYLSEQSEELVPYMEDYFDDKISFDELNYKIVLLDENLDYNKFKKNIIIDELL